MAIFAKKGQKRPFCRGYPENGVFGPFRPSRAGPAQGFYINPYGGGVAQGPGSSREASRTPSRGSARTRSPGPGSWDPGLPRPRGPGGVSGRPRTGSRGPGPRREGGFTSTPRAGAPRFPGAVPGPGGPREGRKGPPGGPPGRQTPPGARKPLPGTAGCPCGPTPARLGVIPLCGVPRAAEPKRAAHGRPRF